MNLVLTEACNKGCLYCFAYGWSVQRGMDMPLEQACAIIDSCAESSIKSVRLLGGEPTLHNEFLKILDYSIRRLTDSTLISNLLFDREILEGIVYLCTENPNKVLHILANGTDTIDDRFVYNYRRLSSIDNIRLSLGITVDRTLTARQHLRYLKVLLDHLPAIGRVRLSMEFPSSVERWYDPVHDRDYGSVLYRIARFFLYRGVPVNFDCIILPCMFTRRQYNILAGETSCKTVCRGPAMDIDRYENVRYCFPCSDVVVHSYGDPTRDRERLKSLYNKRYDMIDSRCSECYYSKRNMCAGPCGAFQHSC